MVHYLCQVISQSYHCHCVKFKRIFMKNKTINYAILKRFLITLILIVLLNTNNIYSIELTNFEIPFNASDSTKVGKLYSPEELKMNSKPLLRIDSIIKDALEKKVFPGCQVVVMKEGKTVYDNSFGYYTYESQQKITSNTLYDLASLSKTTGTLLAIMKLYDFGKLKLTDKASDYLTFLRGTDKENITITDLLFHETGLPGSMFFYHSLLEKNNTPSFLVNDSNQIVRPNSTTMKYKQGWTSKKPNLEYQLQVADSFYMNNRFHDMAMQKIAETKLGSKTYLYSCVNFILLKEVVEALSGMRMDVFLDREFYQPMELKHIAYLPLRTHKKDEIAPTMKKDYLRNGMLQGFVHDPDAAFLGGVSGNAGLFANAQDVASVYQMLLNGGEFNQKRFLSAETCRIFTTTISANGRRGLGFDKPNPKEPGSSPCCSLAPQQVYGHTGYTGTCCWVDPVNQLIYVFLSNRTYPDDGVNKLAKMRIRPKIQKVIYQSINSYSK